MFDLILKTQSLISAANNLGCGGEHCPSVAGVNASQPRLVTVHVTSDSFSTTVTEALSNLSRGVRFWSK